MPLFTSSNAERKHNKKKKFKPAFGYTLKELDDVPDFVKEGFKFLEARGML